MSSQLPIAAFAIAVAIVLTLVFGSGCTVRTEDRFALALIDACPDAKLDDVAARDRCADRLGGAVDLISTAEDVVAWGGLAPGAPLSRGIEASHTTEFEPRVWRRLYLSTFVFGADYRIEEHAPYRVLFVPVTFRGSLPDGEYAYPFWHSADKWASYQEATHLAFLFREGRLAGALRVERDPNRPKKDRTWDGQWRWDEGRQPRVTLFSYAFSPENEHVPALDAAYRALEAESRARGCDTCHSPNNSGEMRSLEILNYPAQALASRRTLVSVLEHDMMPPNVGIPSEAERTSLRDRAQAFVVAADAAIAREAELSGVTKD